MKIFPRIVWGSSLYEIQWALWTMKNFSLSKDSEASSESNFQNLLNTTKNLESFCSFFLRRNNLLGVDESERKIIRWTLFMLLLPLDSLSFRSIEEIWNSSENAIKVQKSSESIIRVSMFWHCWFSSVDPPSLKFYDCSKSLRNEILIYLIAFHFEFRNIFLDFSCCFVVRIK